MSRTTIDFGIDLGTTNSAIAVLKDVATDIIKNNDDQDVTPSAVSYGKNGQVFVGTRAKNAIIDKPKDAYVEFKRRMGTEYSYGFKASGLSKKPEELSAEILLSLRADVARATGEEIHSAVITVPAAFELHQCDATRRAAELAGFKGSPLLQEPVAASLAYGFQIDSEKAYWLVYDFGGGTFDAALIKAEEGLINVVHHGGDNFLGGSDIDWAILERIIAPRLAENYDLPDFKRGNTRWERELLKLKRSVELAKIELTNKNTTTLGDCVFEDDSGEEVDGEEITLTRDDILEITEPIINRSMDICRKVLQEKNLSPGDIQKMILVGGPTKAPYFRNILKEGLGITIDHSVDPLTVVAKGAAVFAGTQKVHARHIRPAQTGEFQIDLKHKPIGHEVDPIVGGKVSGTSGENLEGFTIELVNGKSQWRSGRIPLRADGAFMVNLLAEKGNRNTFGIELFNSSGSRQKTVPDHLVYTIGAVVEEQPLINSMGVALAGNEWEQFFDKGAGLPMKRRSKQPFQTTRPLKAGDTGAAIIIPVVEGENEAADRNRLVGSFHISSEMIKRDLSAGSEIEITLKIDESRIITVVAYVPALDEEFEHQFDLRKKSISAEVIEKDFEKELERLSALTDKAVKAEDEDAEIELNDLEVSDLADDIRESIEAAYGDPDAAEKAEKRLLEFKIKLDEIETRLKWPTLVKDVNDWLDSLQEVVDDHGNREQESRCDDLKDDVTEIIEKKDAERLSKKLRQIRNLHYEILREQPSYWIYRFRRLEGRRSEMSDLDKAEHLYNMGRRYMEQNNIQGLKNVVDQLWDLIPDVDTEEDRHGYGSTLTR
ncbi:MAG: Hsp70 family protein [Candidatus Methylacidiphilales bacterium]|nr:Hsp70 family protein [Candidatus Methylacidiphilales bacterium]